MVALTTPTGRVPGDSIQAKMEKVLVVYDPAGGVVDDIVKDINEMENRLESSGEGGRFDIVTQGPHPPGSYVSTRVDGKVFQGEVVSRIITETTHGVGWQWVVRVPSTIPHTLKVVTDPDDIETIE